jgi:ATP-dependent helicase/nuclease subunit A
VSPIAVRNANSFAEWLILGLLRHPDAIELRDMAENVTVDVLEEETESFIFKTTDINLAEVEDPAPPGMPPPNPVLQQKLQERFEMKNPHEALSRIPVKAAISVLAEEEQAHTFALTARPAFLSKSGLSPAERGTAMHTYLQFADYPAAATDPVGELERLRTKGFLTEEQAAVIEPEKIRALFESPLGQRILHAGQVHREVRFLLDYPAKQWDPAANETDESVVLQGVATAILQHTPRLPIAII